MATITEQIINDLTELPAEMQEETLDFVQVKVKQNRETKPKANGQAIVEILERMAARNSLSHIKDPVAWQREIRKDRPLPGREEG